MFHRILIPVLSGTVAQGTIDIALQLAVRDEAELIGLRVLEPDFLWVGHESTSALPPMIDDPRLDADVQAQALDDLGLLVSAADRAGVRYRLCRTAAVDAVQGILDASVSMQCDLIILTGDRNRQWWRPSPLRSIASRLAVRSSGRVLVIH